LRLPRSLVWSIEHVEAVIESRGLRPNERRKSDHRRPADWYQAAPWIVYVETAPCLPIGGHDGDMAIVGGRPCRWRAGRWVPDFEGVV